jgi:type IV fimbrial biogenesis protein FimT
MYSLHGADMNQRQHHRQIRSAATRRQAGVTLVESLIVLTIIAVTLGAVVPGFESARERRHLEGAAAQFETDVHFVRSLAVAHNRTLRMNFAADATGSCYVVHTGSADGCTCAGDGTLSCASTVQTWRVVHFDATAPVQLKANVRSILFDPHQGTSGPTGTLRTTGRSGAAIHAVVSLMGRVRQCAPAPGLPGVPRC